MNRQSAIIVLSLFAFLLVGSWATNSAAQIEKKILKYLTSERLSEIQADRRCRYDDKYVVYLIDNFEQRIRLTPEVTTSHGELIRKILISGRDDIVVRTLNTSLSRGLAMVIDDLFQGNCADAVISSIPGSNYTYRQIGSLLPGETPIRRENILDYQDELINLLKSIARNGFPSVGWLERVDVNTSKLLNDAGKVFFAEALGRFKVPLLIPYGNEDSTHENEARSVNILSLASNVRAFSALDRLGRRISGYPYSPLSVGDEQAVYQIREIPHPDNPFLAHLDVNDDGFGDYTFNREGRIAFRNTLGLLSFAPPVLSETEFKRLKDLMENSDIRAIKKSVVLTADQYRELNDFSFDANDVSPKNEYVWLNSPYRKTPFHFDAVPWVRGLIKGTSLIPPNKVKELLTMNMEVPR